MQLETATTASRLPHLGAAGEHADTTETDEQRVHDLWRVLAERATTLDPDGANSTHVLCHEHLRLFENPAFREALVSLAYTGYINARNRRAHLMCEAEQADAAQAMYGKVLAFVESVVARSS